MRTDFTDDAAWARVVDEVARPGEEGFEAVVEPVDDPADDGVDRTGLRDAVLAQEDAAVVLFVVDPTTLASADHPVLVVSTDRYVRDRRPEEFEAMRPFRCIPAERWGVENDLDLSNTTWHEFADSVDDTGVHRGF